MGSQNGGGELRAVESFQLLLWECNKLSTGGGGVAFPLIDVLLRAHFVEPKSDQRGVRKN